CSQEESSRATCLFGVDLQAQRYDDPPPLRVQRSVHEPLILEYPEYSLDVVLHVLPVIDEVGIGTSVAWCEQHLDSGPVRPDAQPRLDDLFRRTAPNQRPVELSDE